MRVVWNYEQPNEQGLTLLDVTTYSVDEDSRSLQVHARRGLVVNIPLDCEAARILRLWFHHTYELEKQQLLDALAASGN